VGEWWTPHFLKRKLAYFVLLNGPWWQLLRKLDNGQRWQIQRQMYERMRSWHVIRIVIIAVVAVNDEEVLELFDVRGHGESQRLA
jgi:hypothetical protein